MDVGGEAAVHRPKRGKGEHGVYPLPEAAYELAHSEAVSSPPFDALDSQDWERVLGHLVAHRMEGLPGGYVTRDSTRSQAYALSDALEDYLLCNSATRLRRERGAPIPFEETLLPESERDLCERAIAVWKSLEGWEGFYTPPVMSEPVLLQPEKWDLRRRVPQPAGA